MSYNPALRRPFVRPQAGTTKTRRVNRDGSVSITKVITDDFGVVRRYTTTIVPS
jgi:hypothetical protein